MDWMDLAAAVATALAAASWQADGDTAKRSGFQLTPCTPAGVKAEVRCGTLTVPENRAVKGGRTLPLEVVVIPARSGAPKEPIFILTGGPGQAATEQARWLVDAPERQDHDIVMLDLRGTGERTRLDCTVAPPDAPLQAFIEPPFDDVATFRACRRELEKKADLTQYTTPIGLQDLDELRRALGYGKIYLNGGSYGSRVGLAYIQAYGANVRGAFFSGISAMENRAPLYHAAAAQRAFDLTAEQCLADVACRAAFPDPKGDLRAIRATLRRAPARVKAKHPATGAEGELILTEQGFGDGLRVMLYSEETGRRVPLMIEQARAGDYAPFAQAALNSGYAFRKALAFGQLLSVSCAEDIPRIRPEEISREVGDSFIGDHRVRGQMAACAEWPRGSVPADYNKPFTSSVPVVLVSGNLDPVTPPQWGEVMKRYFPNSVHVVLPGAHVSENPCVQSIARHLFERGSVEGIDTSCVASLKNPPFVLASEPAAEPPSPST